MGETFFMYKGRPLVRNKNVVYYGRMSDPYVVMMQIHSTKKDGELEVADKISMQMMSTDRKKRDGLKHFSLRLPGWIEWIIIRFK